MRRNRNKLADLRSSVQHPTFANIPYAVHSCAVLEDNRRKLIYWAHASAFTPTRLHAYLIARLPVYTVAYLRAQLKGTVQRDFLPPIFSQMDCSQAPYSVFKDFSNLASNLRRYLRFFIDSPLLFLAQSQYSPYCLVRRVATLRFIIAGSHYLLELSA